MKTTKGFILFCWLHDLLCICIVLEKLPKYLLRKRIHFIYDSYWLTKETAECKTYTIGTQ